MIAPTSLSADLCLKCNLCTAACPVAAVTDLFPGPKAVGPQFQRFRHPALPVPDTSVLWCSGCGVCSRVCPHGVPVTETNVQAKARVAQARWFRPRDWLLARPHVLADLASPWPAAANRFLRSAPGRAVLERGFGIARGAPLPPFRNTSLRKQEASLNARAPAAPRKQRRVVAYFHGCSTDRYEWELGAATIAVLGRLGVDVVLPPQGCCGLPLQSNGFFGDARSYARSNARKLQPFLMAGQTLVTTSTSCSLALKHEYRSVLELEGDEFDLLSERTRDVFELLSSEFSGELDRMQYRPIPLAVLYHAPCQLRAHGIGLPVIDVMRRIPGLRLIPSRAECCGVAGTYGLKAEQFGVAASVGDPLFRQIRDAQPDLIATDSETCRWWIGGISAVPAVHPIMLLAAAWGLADLPASGGVGLFD